MAEVSRAAAVCSSLVYKWRREARCGAITSRVSGFVPVVIETPMAPSTATSWPGVIVVEVREARVRISADAPAVLVAATFKALWP